MHDYPAPAHSQAATLSQNEVAILAETFRLLGDPSRLRIVLCCLDGPVPVSEIADLHVSHVLIDMASHIAEDHQDD